MKNLTYVLLIMFVSLTGNTAILTVNNNNPSPGQYSDLQVAIDAASAGDTLLIHRSATTYGNATITKKLVLIGEGVLPNKTPLNLSTLGILTLTYNTTTLEHASKSVISGLSITTINLNEKSSDINYACDSIQIYYCRIGTLTLKNNVYFLTLKNSIVSSISNGILHNFIATYNIIYQLVATATLGENNLLMNNLFMLKLTLGGGVVANNIFYTPIGVFTMQSRNVIFSNNIMYNTTPANSFNTNDYIINGNISVNNQFNIDPLFMTPIIFTTFNTYTHTSPASGPFADFHLQAGSPAIGAGTDGTDLGIYGGSTPWRDGSTTDSRYRYYPLPDAVPVITGVTVQNPVVNEGGNLQIQLNATTAP